jgi:hypothetical protein
LALMGVAANAFAQEITRDRVHVSAIGAPGQWTGFTLTDAGKPIVAVRWDSLGVFRAKSVEARDGRLRFTISVNDGALAADGRVSVRFQKADDYPEVSLDLRIRRFDAVKWEQAHGKAPVHFLAAALPGAPIFHGGGGWPIATPAIDRYPMLGIAPANRKIASEYSENWTYAPSAAAHAVPMAGLWHPDRSLYVGYAFYGSRLAGETPPGVGLAYCWRSARLNEFITLVLPYGIPHRRLRYPRSGDRFAAHFTLLFSTRLPSEADPNAFCSAFAWKRYAALMPSVPNWNDLSWLPAQFRVQDFGRAGYPRLIERHAGDGFIRKGTLLGVGANWLWPLDIGGAPSPDMVAGLRADLATLERYAQRMTVGGDECVYWQWPLEGDWQPQWGAGVPTLHNVYGTKCALAFLDAYRNDHDTSRLAYVDGALRWLKHILYTRNCYPDVPDGMFAWDAAPFVTFCLRYGDTFRNDPKRADMVALADRLARSLAYRCLAMYCSDNDPTDNIDSSWMMGGNAGDYWVGIGSANELWEMTAGILLAYTATGDPVLGQQVRGILDRWHRLFREGYYRSVLDWGDRFAEIWALCDGVPNFPKGSRARFGGLWGGLEQLIYPPGGATVRVVCRQKAAMAFNTDADRAVVADYRADDDASFAFRLVGRQRREDTRSVAVTWPFADLRSSTVRVNGRVVEPKRFDGRADTLLVPNVPNGAVIQVGELPASAPALPCAPAKTHNRWSSARLAGFETVDLRTAANEPIDMDWLVNTDTAGWEGGLKWVLGVPFVLLEPGIENRPVGVSGTASLRAGGRRFFALVSPGTVGSELALRLDNGARVEVPVGTRLVTAIEAWPPCFHWRVELAAVPIPAGRSVRAMEARRCTVFAATMAHESADLARADAAMAAQRVADLTAIALQAARERINSGLRQIGGAAVLPMPPGHDNTPPSLFGAALAQGRLTLLTTGQYVDPVQFNARRYPVAFVFGDENYLQTVREYGDGDRAIIRYLREGGTLVSMVGGPTPFAYNEKNVLLPSYPQFGFALCGQGGTRRPDQPELLAMWEKPPAGRRFVFRRTASRTALPHVPAQFPFYDTGDLRWRPIANLWSPGEADYTPLLTLYDRQGRSHGDGAAIVRFRQGPLAGGRVVYVWMRLWSDTRFGNGLIEDVLQVIRQ